MIIESHNHINKIVKYFIRHINMNIKVFYSMCSNTFVNQYTFVFVENLSDKKSCLTIETIVMTVFYSLLEGIAANHSSRGKFEIRTYAFFLKNGKKVYTVNQFLSEATPAFYWAHLYFAMAHRWYMFDCITVVPAALEIPLKLPSNFSL